MEGEMAVGLTAVDVMVVAMAAARVEVKVAQEMGAKAVAMVGLMDYLT